MVSQRGRQCRSLPRADRARAAPDGASGRIRLPPDQRGLARNL